MSSDVTRWLVLAIVIYSVLAAASTDDDAPVARFKRQSDQVLAEYIARAAMNRPRHSDVSSLIKTLDLNRIGRRKRGWGEIISAANLGDFRAPADNTDDFRAHFDNSGDFRAQAN
ncbi:unnamed protein product [Meganyctiphanes norvegica]|uniref:Uncharacterized protein n=1 Tax=Meganyctiphanes norvegica TaxID=48144 RepID=A0AAV2QXQ9_MEGNR